MEHCIAVFQKSQENKIFKDYLTESIRLHVQGKYLSMKFDDIIHPKPAEPEKTGEEIIAHMKQKLASFGGK